MPSILPFIKKTIKRSIFMFPAHALVFVLTWLGTGPSPIPLLTFVNLPLIYILVRKSPTLINIPLLTALTLGAGFAHNEPSTSPMESYFDDLSILTIVGSSIAIITLVPMIITKYIIVKINERFEDFTHDLNSKMIFPVVWTATWSLFRRYSPLGSWGDWAYTINNAGYTGDPIMQIASIGGLSAINLFLALWTQVISDFLILNHRISRADRTMIIDEGTPLLFDTEVQVQQSRPSTNVEVYKEDLNKNYYLRIMMIVTILSCFFIGGERLIYIESNVDPMPTETVGCVLPKYDSSMEDLITSTITVATGLKAKIVLWSESAIALKGQDELNDLLKQAHDITTQYHFYLGLTYTIPTGNNGHKKKNMLRFIGNDTTIFEYQKTHPVPWVESYSTESGPGSLKKEEIHVEFKKEKGRNHNLTLSGAICLDMDFPELLGQAAGVDLVLSPAQTWSAHVGLQHLRMSSVRAIENGYWILRCDGGGASGLIDPYGRVRHMQIASNDHTNIFAWEMPLEGERIETYYAKYGEFTVWVTLIVLGVCELIWLFSWNVAEQDMEEITNSVKEFIKRRQEWAEEKYDEIFDQDEFPQPSLI